MITLTKERYETLGHLGSGASSRVDKARDNVIGRTVALKTFLNDFGPGLEQQFLREAQIIGQLSNPSIVQLYDVGINEHGIPFLVMEYVAGNTLEDHLDPSALPLQRACAWAADLAGALALAHRAGIIHGDVKPGNIFVTAEYKVKLGDFGIARFASQISGSGNLMGTPAYLAPEQIQGEPQDPRSDQFALGIVLYQMVSGVKPFDGSSLGAVCSQILNAEPMPPSRHNPAVPKALDRIIARCLAKNPKDRFAHCDELASVLYPFARSSPSSAAPKIKKPFWWSKPGGQRDVWITAAACLLLAGSVPVSQSLRARFTVPPAPAFHFSLPEAPSEAFTHTLQTVTEAPVPVTAGDLVSQTAQERPHRHANRPAKLAAARTKQPGVIPQGVSSPKIIASTAPEPAAPAATAPTLQIEITSAVAEGTLAIFADRELLFTINFATAAPGEPIHFEHAVPAGPHQFRVALYKPDKSLRLEKEGLAEIRSDGANTLAVRVNRRAKLLVRREFTLEVTWPAGSAAASERGAAHVKTSALLK
ncbi:MAG: serine/threonine-protein kinase [Candidatus Acidiferrum sp.]